MKKIIFALASVLVATAFAPEATALPAFARQTGMACSACHQQHFPVLNKFGQIFKAGGYTMIGAQGKVEGDHLAIPDTLNGALLLKLRYQNQKNGDKGIKDGMGTVLDGTGDGQWQFGDELSLFFGGRVAENVGFIFEGNAVSGGNLLAGLRMPFMFDIGNSKLSVVPFTTDALGVAYGYELSSAGVLRANRWSESRRDISAIQFALVDGNGSHGNFVNAATGFAFVVQNDMGYINVTRWTPNYAPGSGGQNTASFEMTSNYLRIAATPTLGDWAMVGGVGVMSGESELAGAGTANVVNSGLVKTKASFADLQAHGHAGGKDLGVYLTYARAPAAGGTCGAGTLVATGCNAYNDGVFAKKAATIGADYSVIPNVLHLGANYRAGTLKTNLKDNSVMIQAIYDMAQNVALHAIYATRSGSAYEVAGSPKRGKNEYLLMLEAAW